jgi:thiamine pyrophosphate-dependent acetolactate synthase large subunit-like protein
MILSTYIADFIDTLWWEYVFWVCGIPNVPIYEELQKKNIKVTQNTHEAFSIFSCIWAYYYTKKIHFAVVTAGPGVTNTITPLSEAYISNTPVFLISINSDSDFYATWEKHDSSSWDLGVDTISLTKDITCFSAVWLSAKNTILLLERAYKVCMSKSKPVHVSLPRDFLTQDIWTPPNIKTLWDKNNLWLDAYYKISERFTTLWKDINNSLFVINTDDNVDEILETLDSKNVFIASSAPSLW